MLIQFTEVLHQLCPQGIQMNIPDQFKQIGVFLTQYGFITILEELSVSMVTVIVFCCVSR